MSEAVHDLDAAVIGMDGRVPGARNPREDWNNIRNGVESIRELSVDELIAAGVSPDALADADYVRACAVLDDADRFDSGFFGYSPREAKLLDPQSRVFLECAWEAFENAGYNPHRCGEVVGVYGGQSLSTYLLNQVGPGSTSGSSRSLRATSPAFSRTPATSADAGVMQLRLTGPSVNVQTACSSSLVAVHTARQALLNGSATWLWPAACRSTSHSAVATGATKAISCPATDTCRPFDAAASGTIFGRGPAWCC